MAIQASGRKSTTAANSQRALFHVRNFILGLNPAHITILEENAAGGSWASEATVGDGAYLVLQSAFTVGGSKWQLFLGARSTTGNLTPGWTGSYCGIYAAFSWDGSWDSVQKKFTGLAYGPYKIDRGSPDNMGPLHLEMSVTERLSPATGAVADIAFILVADNLQDSYWESGIYAGTFHPADTVCQRPTCILIGAPNRSGTGWPNINAPVGACLASDNQTIQALFTWPSADGYMTNGWFFTDDAGGWYGAELLIYNKATSRVKGRLVEVYRVDASIAIGSKTADGKWISLAYDQPGLLFPSA
jgi:hypothetical protein